MVLPLNYLPVLFNSSPILALLLSMLIHLVSTSVSKAGITDILAVHDRIRSVYVTGHLKWDTSADAYGQKLADGCIIPGKQYRYLLQR